MRGNIAETVIEAINKIGSVFFGPILATFLAAVQFKRIHARSINIGLVTGVAVNIYLWLGVGDQLFWFWWNATGTVVTLGVASLFSAILPQPKKRTDFVKTDTSGLWSKDTLILTGFFILIIAISIAVPSLI